MRQDGADDPAAPILGAVVAAGVACVAPVARMTLNKGLGISDALLGVAEDYVALRLGTEATGMTMNQVSEAAQDAFGELRGQVMQSLPSGSNSSRQATAAAVR